MSKYADAANWHHAEAWRLSKLKLPNLFAYRGVMCDIEMARWRKARRNPAPFTLASLREAMELMIDPTRRR